MKPLSIFFLIFLIASTSCKKDNSGSSTSVTTTSLVDSKWPFVENSSPIFSVFGFGEYIFFIDDSICAVDPLSQVLHFKLSGNAIVMQGRLGNPTPPYYGSDTLVVDSIFMTASIVGDTMTGWFTNYLQYQNTKTNVTTPWAVTNSGSWVAAK